MNPIREYLQSGESLLWEGQPDPARYSRRGLLFAVPFGCAFTGFALFWVAFTFALTRGNSGGVPVALFPLFGVPFVLVGLYILVGRLFVAAHQARSTWYAVTDRRVLIVTGRRCALTELALTGIPAMQVDEQGDGFGSIAFGATAAMSFLPGLSGGPAYVGGTRYAPMVPAFQSIPHVRAVYDRVKGAQARNEGEREGPYGRDEPQSAWEPPRWPGRGRV